MAGLTASQLERFQQDGYLVVDDVLSEIDLMDIRDEYEGILNRVAADLAERGLIRPLQADSFSQRYIEVMEQLDDMYLLYQHLDISLPLMHDLPPDTTMSAGPAVFRLLTNPRLLDLVESVIGPEIYSNPVQHARIKPPIRFLHRAKTDANVAATAWHQDAAVVDPEADDTDMLTVWVAVTDATVENGCLVTAPSSHRADPTLHCPGKIFPAEIYIPEALVGPGQAPLEMKAGSVLLLHRMTKHGSLENYTDDIRWSFDLRYQPIGQPTGRECFPGFVARSRAHPETVLTDPQEWANLWWEARDGITSGRVPMHIGGRWNPNAAHPVCA